MTSEALTVRRPARRPVFAAAGGSAVRYLSHSANDLFWFILPLVLPALLVRYNLSYTSAGGILTFYLALTAIGSYVMGRVSDAVPRRIVMGAGFYLAASGLIAAGFAPSFPVFLVFLAFTAVGVSTFHPAMYAHIDETFAVGKPRVLGTYEAFGTGAILLMFLINGTLLQTLGLRGVLIITAIPALVMGSVMFRSRVIDAVSQEPTTDAPVVAHISMSLFILFLLSIVLRTASITAVLNFLPTIFVGHFGLEPGRAAYATGLFFAGGILGSLGASRFSRKDLSYRILVIGALIAAPIIASTAFTMPLIFHMVLVFVLGAVGSGLVINQNLILTTMGSRFGKGEVFGILMAVMTLTSSITPTIFGFAVDTRGFTFAILTFSTPVFLSGLLLMVLSRRILAHGSEPSENQPNNPLF